MTTSGHTGTDIFTTPRYKTARHAAVLARRNRRPVIFPLFEEAASHSTDRYWIEHLQAAARGKFPKGIFPREGCLIFLHKNVERKLPMADTAGQLAKDFIQFLQDHLGMRSDKDLEFARLNAELLASAERQEVNWNGLNKRSKAWMLERYSFRMASSLSLKEESRQQLLQTLLTGLYVGTFDSKSIHYEGGRVVEVEGLIYKRGRFSLDPNVLERCTAEAHKKIQDCPEVSMLDRKHPAFRPRKSSVVKQLAEYLAKCETTKKAGLKATEVKAAKKVSKRETADSEEELGFILVEDDE